MTASPSEDDMDVQQIRLALHDEVDRLPDPIRRPILMCYLEGRSNEEAARLIGCPLGTLKDRLSKGRELLRGRLARRGIALTVALLLLLLPGAARAEDVPPWLIAATVERARGRTGRWRAVTGPAVRGSRVASGSFGGFILIASTFAWTIRQPSPARGTWMRWLFDLAHKVCQ